MEANLREISTLKIAVELADKVESLTAQLNAEQAKYRKLTGAIEGAYADIIADEMRVRSTDLDQGMAFIETPQ